MDKLTIATRGSKLALWQAHHTKELLEGLAPGIDVDLLVLKTTGDIILDVPLSKVGGKGLFTKEIEEALLDGRADLAVHSMKDVPTKLPDTLTLGITMSAEAPTDTLCLREHGSLAELPQGAVVGTSSFRRQAQLLALRPDLEIKMLRGNVDTRLRKLAEGEYDAIILATAGMKRLGLSAPKEDILGPPDFLPAICQGVLGLEHREAHGELAELLKPLHHGPTAIRVAAERGFLTELEGGCQVPIAGHAVVDGDSLTLTGLVADLQGKRVVRRETSGPAPSAQAAWDMGTALAREVLAGGGKEILDEIYAEQE